MTARFMRRPGVSLRNLGPAIAGAVLLWSAPGLATWSILAVDPDTEQVGIAVATCGPIVQMSSAIVPGEGGVAALAYSNLDARDEIARRLGEGEDADQALAAVLDPDFDPETELRQYGVVSLRGDAASFSGDGIDPWSGSRTSGQRTVQGNILRSREVIDDCFVAFDSAEGEPLAERLLRALEAAAAAGGDSRCDKEHPARSAFLWVAEPDDEVNQPSLKLEVWYAPLSNPVEKLRADYERHIAGGCSSLGATGRTTALPALLALALLLIRRRR